MLIWFLEIVALACAFCVFVFAASQAWLAHLYRKSKKSEADLRSDAGVLARLPSVLIQLPIYNEKLVVERLLRSVAQIDYPANLLTIQLLDDSTDETSRIAAQVIASIAKSGGPQINHIRRSSREGFKAGALAYGLQQDQSELVAIFDADFLPGSDFVRRLVPYFSNPKVGLVQTRWDYVNRDYSLLTRLMAFAIDNHFSVEQGGRQNLDCFVNFNGTAGMWRRKAIDESGGWSADCLTEDLDLSFRSQLKGWEFLFVESVSTPSELPITMQAIRNQQARWTKGAAETGRKNMLQLWRSGQNLRRKVIGSFHLFNSSIFLPLLMLGIFVSTLAFFPEAASFRFGLWLHLFMAASLIAILFTYWVSRRYGGFEWLNASSPKILGTSGLFVLMTLGFSLTNGWAAIQGLMGKDTTFQRTPKFNVTTLGEVDKAAVKFDGLMLPGEFHLECLLLAYFGLALMVALANHNYTYVDVLAAFFVGFALTIYFTLRDRFVSGGTNLAPVKSSVRFS